MRLFRIAIIILPVLFTAQACNFLFGDLFQDEGTGPQGVFLSTDSGDTWQEANKLRGENSLAGLTVASISIEKASPNNVLASTIEGGVFASDNRGENWVPLLPNIAARETFVNPGASQEIYAAGSQGKLAVILKSRNRGGSWEQIYQQPAGEAAVSTLIFEETRPQLLYAGLTNGTIIKSSDGGNTWNVLHDFSSRIVKLAVVRGGALYALVLNQGLRRSIDGGTTWTGLSVVKGNEAAPSQYEDLYLGTGNRELIYLATSSGIFRSQDGGLSWNKLLLPAAPEANDISAIALDPENDRRIFASIRSTFYRSDDNGATWKTVALPTGQTISHIGVDPSEPNRIYVGFK